MQFANSRLSRSPLLCTSAQRHTVSRGQEIRHGLGKQSLSFDLTWQRVSIFSSPHKPSLRNGNLTVTASQAPPARQQPSKNNTPNKRKHNISSPPILETNNIWSALFSRLAKAAALLALAAAVALGGPRSAEAARSGGRMGGSSFGRSMYGGSFGGGGYGSAASAFGGRSSFGGGGATYKNSFGSSYGMMSPFRSSVSTNAFFFSPFGMGYGYGYPMGGGGGLTSLLFWGIFAVIMVQVVRGVLNRNDSGSNEYIGSGSSGRVDSGERLSVAKVQVGLLGTARDLQKDLERIAAKADTSSSRGLHFVLQETVLSLMRNPDYCVYGFAKSGVENSADEAESRFNKLSLEERGKFEKETRVNVGGRTGSSSLNIKKTLTTPINELIVVTILVAVEGRVRLPKVTGRNTLIEALTTLGAVPAADVLAVEVLWTPEEEDDYFTQEDLSVDYPLLNTL
ncbi:hypothetical protein Ndes2526B_g08622 [Nannochloris sp. 'desiccata']|nr:hypothetical protein KSW81_001790 [Chlorella desiccata (nom. nud.)]KAH7616223.1 hypothetical protein NADE_001051 [Chlorella desiccata (nom. nud.)]KAH7616533.1 hypothetical protein NADE_001346 [Chlorella desiccata (nom. nud.)]